MIYLVTECLLCAEQRPEGVDDTQAVCMRCGTLTHFIGGIPLTYAGGKLPGVPDPLRSTVRAIQAGLAARDELVVIPAGPGGDA